MMNLIKERGRLKVFAVNTGESIMLTKEEARRHDCIFLAEVMATLEDRTLGTGMSKHWDIMRKHLDWFRQHNAKAYMVLLD